MPSHGIAGGGCHERFRGLLSRIRRHDQQVPGIGIGVAPYALDPTNAERLWNLSLELLADS
ncbi:hypothetical protein [Streptomyces sp. uw30]|uniref:hypothetical protein n=1 Tax=Streptomyces sp. uw30 TaxID=1828179 RepID=UPI001C9C844E|nr:hypothetical protein [Streptomyces sp. uw30]